MNNELFQILIGLVAFFGGIMIRRLLEDTKELGKKMTEMQVLVAGDYVKKDYLDSKIDALFTKIDHIDSKLDNKVSRVECNSCLGKNGKGD